MKYTFRIWLICFHCIAKIRDFLIYSSLLGFPYYVSILIINKGSVCGNNTQHRKSLFLHGISSLGFWIPLYSSFIFFFSAAAPFYFFFLMWTVLPQLWALPIATTISFCRCDHITGTIILRRTQCHKSRRSQQPHAPEPVWHVTDSDIPTAGNPTHCPSPTLAHLFGPCLVHFGSFWCWLVTFYCFSWALFGSYFCHGFRFHGYDFHQCTVDPVRKINRAANYSTWTADVQLWFQGQGRADHLTTQAKDIPTLEQTRWKQVDASLCSVL